VLLSCSQNMAMTGVSGIISRMFCENDVIISRIDQCATVQCCIRGGGEGGSVRKNTAAFSNFSG